MIHGKSNSLDSINIVFLHKIGPQDALDNCRGWMPCVRAWGRRNSSRFCWIFRQVIWSTKSHENPWFGTGFFYLFLFFKINIVTLNSWKSPRMEDLGFRDPSRSKPWLGEAMPKNGRSKLENRCFLFSCYVILAQIYQYEYDVEFLHQIKIGRHVSSFRRHSFLAAVFMWRSAWGVPFLI